MRDDLELGATRRGQRDRKRARDAPVRDDTVDLVLRALWEAADEDSATGGPDLIRGIFPVVATITADGFDRLGDDELESRTSAVLDGVRQGGSR